MWIAQKKNFVQFRRRLTPPLPRFIFGGIGPGGYYDQKINFVLQTSVIAQIVAIGKLSKLYKYTCIVKTIFHIRNNHFVFKIYIFCKSRSRSGYSRPTSRYNYPIAIVANIWHKITMTDVKTPRMTLGVLTLMCQDLRIVIYP